MPVTANLLCTICCLSVCLPVGVITTWLNLLCSQCCMIPMDSTFVIFKDLDEIVMVLPTLTQQGAR